MPIVIALAVALGLVAVATAVGFALRAWSRRPRRGETPTALAGLVAPDAQGDRATVVLFSTAFCARCPATRRSLDDLARREAGVARVDVDLTDDPDLARDLRIAQTPTVFVLDADGSLHARFGGAVTAEAVEAELGALAVRHG